MMKSLTTPTLACSLLISLAVSSLSVAAEERNGQVRLAQGATSGTPALSDSQAAPAKVTTGSGAMIPRGKSETSAAPVKRHALSLVGKPKFGPDFEHFDWVNPNAPKGGRVRQWGYGSFDSLNPFTVKGSSPLGLGNIHSSLMTSSADEPSTVYGEIAEWVSYPDDFSSATFGLRASAKFHDGEPIKPEDVIFSLNALKKAHPFFALYYKNVTKVEKTGEREVTFRFDVKGNRELPQIIAELVVLPKHFWTGKDADGKPRDITKSTLEVPLGSGVYKVAKVDRGRKITYERVKDWWGKDLPVNKGQYNFDEISFTYFRDPTPAFEAFKSGELDFWDENSAKRWATGYNIPAVNKGLIIKKKIHLKQSVPMQAFVMNTRRDQFKDARVRQAFNLVYDFEWANKNLFYGQYKRVRSYFQNTELESKGLPKGRELEILKELGDLVPPEALTKEYRNPLNKSSRDRRKHMGMALRLLNAAGWSVTRGSNGKTVLRDKDGKPFKVEFLLAQQSFEKVVLPFKNALGLLGISASVRTVDSAQYERRRRAFDYDIVIGSFHQSHSPGNEQRNFWGSAAADKKGSRNLAGIKNPAVDKLIDKIILAKDRAELVATTHALDRVLQWNHYVVPQWYAPYERVVMWDKFKGPKKQPSQSVAFLRTWWQDDAAAKALAAARGR